MTLTALVCLAALYGDTPDAKHAWGVHDWNRPKPAKVEPAVTCGGAPSDAVVLFDGSEESFRRNWCDNKGNPSGWIYDSDLKAFGLRLTSKDGKWNTGVGPVFTRAAFGDCQLHLEYRHDPTKILTDRGPQMRGNSGVFLMGNYEIQVLESYSTSRDLAGKSEFVDNYTDGQAGSVYAENPPMVNPARKPGEWQVYDIVFHQPVWEGLKLIHPGSISVFFNGVLVQDHWEMEGLTTHCRRRPLAPHPTMGQLMLQDHGCEVSFRNIWYRPLPSRWANRTHSVLSGDENEVMALRRQTAAALYAKIENPKLVSANNLKALAEVIAYANEGAYKTSFEEVLASYQKAPGGKEEVADVNRTLTVLIRNGVIPETSKIK